MSANNEYKRYFIILQEDDKGYEMAAGKIPTGYVKIEVKHGKVKLTAFVQNVKSEEKMEYHLILVAPGKKMAVDVGKVIVDNGGRGELYYEFESDNVLKSSLNISDFSVAAVTSGLSVPLSGYSGREKMEWKGRYDIVNRPKTTEERIDKMKGPVEEIAPMMETVPLPPVEMQMPMAAEQPITKKKEAPVEEIKPIQIEKPEPVLMPIVEEKPKPIPIPIPIPVPIPIVKEKPVVVEKEVKVIVEKPVVVEKEVIVEKTIFMEKPEVEIKPVEFCPPMAPMEEPCEMKHEKDKDMKYEYYYYDEEDSSDDSDDSDEHHKKHEHKEKYEVEEEECPESMYYESDIYRRLTKVLRKLRRCEPFDEEKRDHDWFKIGDDIYLVNSVAIPFMGYMVPLGYPYMMEECVYMMGRKDYILGVKYDRHKRDEDDRDEDYRDKDDRKKIRHIMFGIPAVHNKRNEMYYKSKGFVHYKPHKSNSYGYFIMCLDLETGMPARMD